MIVAGWVLGIIAALLHVYIFWMESVTWTSARTRATFGVSETEAEATKELAFNQGFYNLFLAIVTVVGVALAAAGHAGAGNALVFAGIGSMLAAALVLFISSPGKRGAAVKQGTLPLVGVIVLAIGLAIA